MKHKIALFVAVLLPSLLPAQAGNQLSVQIQDSSGNPILTRSSGILTLKQGGGVGISVNNSVATLSAVPGSIYVDGISYTSIQAAETAACAATPIKTLVIPSSYVSQSVFDAVEMLNPNCGNLVIDQRSGEQKLAKPDTTAGGPGISSPVYPVNTNGPRMLATRVAQMQQGGPTQLNVLKVGDSVAGNVMDQSLLFLGGALGQAGAGLDNSTITPTVTGGAHFIDGTTYPYDYTRWIEGTFTVLPSTGAALTVLYGGGSYPCNQFKVFYLKEPGAGSFNVNSSVNSGTTWVTQSTVNAANATEAGGVLTLSLPLNAYRFQIVNTTTSTVRIIGIQFVNTTINGIISNASARGGWLMADALTTPSAITQPIFASLGVDHLTYEMKEAAYECATGACVISSIPVTNGGSGYTSAPTVNISSASGGGASATAVIAGGVVTGITVNAGGTQYAPEETTVTLTGGGGTGATAGTIVVTNGGSSPYGTVLNSFLNIYLAGSPVDANAKPLADIVLWGTEPVGPASVWSQPDEIAQNNAARQLAEQNGWMYFDNYYFWKNYTTLLGLGAIANGENTHINQTGKDASAFFQYNKVYGSSMYLSNPFNVNNSQTRTQNLRVSQAAGPSVSPLNSVDAGSIHTDNFNLDLYTDINRSWQIRAQKTAAVTVGSGSSSFVALAASPGTAGNSITVQVIVAGTNTPFSISAAGNAITINSATDGSGVATTVANTVPGLIAADAGASSLITATGSNTGVLANVAATALTSGAASTMYGQLAAPWSTFIGNNLLPCHQISSGSTTPNGAWITADPNNSTFGLGITNMCTAVGGFAWAGLKAVLLPVNYDTTFGATTTIDFNKGNAIHTILTGNTTISPTNIRTGADGLLQYDQNATGGWTATFTGASAPNLVQPWPAPNSKTWMRYYVTSDSQTRSGAPAVVNTGVTAPNGVIVLAPVLASDTAANTDSNGELSLSAATTISYTFANVLSVHPEVVLQPQFDIGSGNRYWVTYTGTTGFTINFATAVTGAVTYHCYFRN